MLMLRFALVFCVFGFSQNLSTITNILHDRVFESAFSFLSFQTKSIYQCAQLCIQVTKCESVNYKNGLCKLNNNSAFGSGQLLGQSDAGGENIYFERPDISVVSMLFKLYKLAYRCYSL